GQIDSKTEGQPRIRSHAQLGRAFDIDQTGHVGQELFGRIIIWQLRHQRPQVEVQRNRVAEGDAVGKSNSQAVPIDSQLHTVRRQMKALLDLARDGLQRFTGICSKLVHRLEQLLRGIDEFTYALVDQRQLLIQERVLLEGAEILHHALQGSRNI